MRKSRLFVSMPLLALLSACGGHHFEKYDDPTKNYVAPEISSSVDTIIQEESRQAVASQRVLAMIQRTRTPPTMTNPDDGAPPELSVRLTELNWAGPVDGLLSDIAERVGYRYIKPGFSTGYDVPVVNLDIQNETVAKALDDISLQIQQTTQIIVNPDEKTITLRPNGEPKEFHSVTGGGASVRNIRHGHGPAGHGPVRKSES